MKDSQCQSSFGCADIPLYPGYTIWTDGSVRRNGKKIVPYHNGRGYLRVRLFNSGKKYSVALHRLVAETFLPNPANLPVINHIDGDKHNNNVDNLEWVSYADNTAAWRNRMSAVTRPICRLSKGGKVIEFFASVRIAAKAHGYDYRTFYDAIKRNATYKGYNWCYCLVTVTPLGNCEVSSL